MKQISSSYLEHHEDMDCVGGYPCELAPLVNDARLDCAFKEEVDESKCHRESEHHPYGLTRTGPPLSHTYEQACEQEEHKELHISITIVGSVAANSVTVELN